MHTNKETGLNKNEGIKINPCETLCGLRRETPEFRRCCVCIPLRRGLIGWGYVKLALNMWVIGLMVYLAWYYLCVEGVVIVEIVLLLIDASFTVVFIVGGHQKNIKFLKITYIYSIMWLGLVLLGLCWLTYGDLKLAALYITEHEHYSHILPLLIIGFCAQCSIFFLQMYWVLMIRSLVAKLRGQAVEIQFTNTSTAEAQCSLHKHNPLAAEAQCSLHKHNPLAAEAQCSLQKHNPLVFEAQSALHNPSVTLTEVGDRPDAKPDRYVECTSPKYVEL